MNKVNVTLYCSAASVEKPPAIDSQLVTDLITSFGAGKVDPDRAGLYINSPFLQDLLLERASSMLKKEDLAYFDPFVFARGIVNAISASVNKKLKLQNLSATYNSSFLSPVLADFTCSPLTQALIVHLTQDKHYCAEFFLLDKKSKSSLQLTGWTHKQEPPPGIPGLVSGADTKSGTSFSTFRSTRSSSEVLFWEYD